MKKTLSAIVAAVLLTSSTVSNATVKSGSKDECLLYGKNCMVENSKYSIPEKIIKLQIEIARGENVYSAGELVQLNYKLKDAEAILRSLNKGGK